MKPVSIVTIKNKIPLFKGEEEANSIELIELEENGFQIVSQKDLYEVRNKAVYIQPDYCLSDKPIFESFIRPNGDPKKSRLGSNNRIRAVKFNLHTGNNLPVYSQGILLPIKEVDAVLNQFVNEGTDLTKELGIVKWEEPDETFKGGVKGGYSHGFPEGMYKTDENNINNLWGHIQFPIELIGTEKIDGSSITLFYKDGKSGICSRQLLKPLTYTKIKGLRKLGFMDRLKQFLGAKVEKYEYETIESDSDFVKYGKEYLHIFEKYCKDTNRNLALRGELNGSHLKGSGNKNNPARKDTPHIKFYGLDLYNSDTIKLGEKEFETCIAKCEFPRCKKVFQKTFNNRQELEEECNTYFLTNLIEGIVVRTPDHNFSAKVMNPEYDSKK